MSRYSSPSTQSTPGSSSNGTRSFRAYTHPKWDHHDTPSSTAGKTENVRPLTGQRNTTPFRFVNKLEVPHRPLDSPAPYPPRAKSVSGSQYQSREDPPPGQRPRPKHDNVCMLSVRGACPHRYRCSYLHQDLKYDPPKPMSASFVEPIRTPSDPPPGRRPYPPSSETCRKWLANRCHYRFSCKHRHPDLEYDPPLRPPGLSPPRSWTVKVQDHAKIKLGPGFEIQEVTTGFETPWVYLSKLPNTVTYDEVDKLLQDYGDIQELRMPNDPSSLPTVTVRARYSTAAEALDASSRLNGSVAFGATIVAGLPINNSSAFAQKTVFQDTSVRIRWQAPSKIAYCGYPTMEAAQKAMEAAQFPFKDHFIHTSIHNGLPVAGVVTVRFRGVPLDATVGDMERFNHPESVVWGQPNYTGLVQSINGIRRLLAAERTEVLDLTILPPPYRNGAMILAYAHFSTVSDAKAAQSRINGKKPSFTGKTVIHADHLQSLTFSISPALYSTLRPDINALCKVVKGCRRTSMTVFQHLPPHPSTVRLSGDDIKELGQLKAEFERILGWEIVKMEGRVAWDPFFACDASAPFLESLRLSNPSVMIEVNRARRAIRLRGWYGGRQSVRERLFEKLRALQAEIVRFIPLPGFLLARFMGRDLVDLEDRIGRHNVLLDLMNRQLKIRGNDTIYHTARDAVDRVRRSWLYVRRPQRPVVSCPVCFDEVIQPMTLLCGHKWCRACISGYLTASIENKTFPLTCLGDEGKCTERIPLTTARIALSASEFDSLAEAAFTAHIQARTAEFHYCPTPDCSQVYRSGPRREDVVLQCPSCLVRICPNCHVEAHDGFECPDPDGGNNLFKEWIRNNDVKPCPGCKIPIERAEGCNHMTCTQCKTHICWVCMQTFPGGAGIYDHMRSAHGGIGVPEIEI